MNKHSLHTEIVKNHLQFRHCFFWFSTAIFLFSSALLYLNLKLEFSLISTNCFFILSFCLIVPLMFHNYWPKSISFMQPYYWITALSYVLPFQFSLLLLFNQNIIIFHLLALMSFIALILLVNTLFVAPISIISIMTAYITYCLITKNTSIDNNLIVTTFSCLIIGLFICVLEWHRKKYVEKQMEHWKLISGSIAHELRTPLSSTLIGLDTLISKLSNEAIPPNIFNTLGKMQSTSKTALTSIDIMVNNIRDYKEIEKTPLSLSNCLLSSIAEYPLSQEEQIRIHLKIDNDYLILGNHCLLKQVIWNLMKNAIYQIKENNKGEIYISLRYQRKKVIFTFKDTAKGITDIEARYLFDKFHSNTKNGSGLGLTFCKTIVELHAGQISFNYSPEHFIEFVISFPILT